MGIKFIDPKAVTKIVSMSDDAIDKENSDLVLYQETYDIKHLKFIEGEKPTYFMIGNIGSTDLVQIQQDHYVTEMPKLAPGEVLDMKTFKPKITPVKTGEMLVKYFRHGVKKIITENQELIMSDDLLDTIPSIVLQEIGAFIMQRSFLNDSKKK